MSQGIHLRKYGVQATIDFEVYEVDGVDLRVDWVPAQADCEIMKDGGASTLCDNTATDEGSTYSIVLTATEMQFARGVLKIVDAAAKVFLDKVVIIETYGNASAQHAEFPADVTKVSGDTTAADNLELMYDGTGYTDPTAPASRAQADGLGAGPGSSVNINATEDNTGGAIIDGVTFVGSVQGATTFANTEAEDGVFHDIDDTGDDIDIVYGFDVGGGRTASSVDFAGFVQGNGDEIKIKVFDHVGSDWEIIGTISGTNGTTNTTLDLPLLLKHTGTGGELGKTYIRFETDSTTPSNLSVDKLLIAAVNIGQSVGYANGQVWVDTADGVAGTEAFVNGVADQAVNLWASALTIATAVGLSDFHIINGSTITLTGNSDSFSVFGDNWILALASRSVANAHFQGANVTGICTAATEVHFDGCEFGTASVQLGHFDFCSFDGTLTMTLAGDYNYHNCYSKVAGAGAPTFAKTAGQAITAQWRNWQGGITLSGLEVGDTLTIGGRLGTVDLGSPGGAVAVEIRGTYKEITNVGSASVNTDGAIKGVDVADIFIRTGYAENSIWIDTVNGTAGTTDYTHGVESNPVNSIADANTLAASLNIKRFVIAPGSSITFAATQTGQVFTGDRWTLALGGQNVVNSTFIGAVVSGVMAGTGVMQTFINCVMNATSIIKGTIYKGCTLAATQTVVEAGEFLFSHCYSSIAGTGTVTFDFGSALNSSNLSIRHHSGGWTIENMGAGTGTYNATFEGEGQIIWAASCSATSNASIRGHWKITDNASGAVTETKDDITTDVDTVKVATDKLTFTVANQVDSNVKAISDDTTAADRLEALMDGIVVAQVNDGSATITAFAADGFTEATDDHFKARLITFISGALSGQQTDITGYDAAGGAQGSQEFTVTALTEAPAEDDFFVIH